MSEQDRLGSVHNLTLGATENQLKAARLVATRNELVRSLDIALVVALSAQMLVGSQQQSEDIYDIARHGGV
ncbi:hypothetical protein [Halobellus captivus]|uniref:hypothetical protein n=1 Tax=Halobellus captivus TaxID=2592614 RepID=UPI00193A800A|nr:hypothetical protein [Halobellus captivus]